MSKKLFTKLELTALHSESQNTVNSLLETIISSSVERLQQGQIRKLSKQLLTKEVMYRQINSLGQAYPSNPIQEKIEEDQAQILKVREGSRPFSAKIEKFYRPGTASSKKSSYIKRVSARSSYKYSVCYSAKSRQRRNGIFRPNNNRVFPLNIQNDSLNDSVQQAFIDSLRQKKAQELAYQRSKQNFLKASAEQNERYPKLNKKFLQTMGSKQYYYNKNGETVELAPNQAKLHKKAALNRVSARTQITKRSNEVRSQLIVEYQEKQNYFKKTREAFEIQARPPMLFYKSEQCKYQIIA